MGAQLAHALRHYFRRPPAVLQLAFLATLLSAAIIVLMAVGSAQVLAVDGSEALPMVYLLLAAVSVPLASGISAALGRWSVARISTAIALASACVVLALRGALALELPGASSAVCITAYALEIVFDTLFWLSASEHLPTLELKRHTPFLAGAFGLGGIFAGFLATAFCAFFAGENLLLLDAGLFALCVLQYRRINRFCSATDADDEEGSEPGVVESMKATLGVVRAFPITGAISAGVLLMSALFCLQDYLAMTAYQAAFPSADALSSFMAIVYAGHQAAELLIIAACGRLILERAGPVLRNLIFPTTTCAGLVGLLGFGNLGSAVFVHANVIALSNAVFEPVKTLNFAALPYRVLAQVRMVVDGVLYPLGIALSALALVWLQSRTEPQTILQVSIAVAAVFFGVSAVVGIWFLPNLLRSLRLRAIIPSEYGRCEQGRIFSAGDIRHLLHHPDPEARQFGVVLATSLAPELLSAAPLAPDTPAPLKDSTLAWPIPQVDGATAVPETADNPLVQLREEDLAVLGDRAQPARRAAHAGRRSVRRRRSDAVIWRFAMIERTPSAKRLEEIGRGLEARSISMRRSTASLLARLGASAVPVAEARLHSDRPEVVEAAIHALGGIGTRQAEQILRDHLRPLYLRVPRNLDALDALHRLVDAPAAPRQALEAWLIDSNRRIMRHALVVKAALGNPRDVKLLDALSRAHEARTRSDAVEALVNLPTRRFIQPLVPLLEARSDTSATPANIQPRGEAPAASTLIRILEAATTTDPWARLLVMRLTGELTEGRHRGDGSAEHEAMLDLVLFLKTVPLFRVIPLEDIARVARIAESLTGEAGETIIEADHLIGHVYIIRSGSADVQLNGRTAETIGAGTSFGETAVFGEERHAATVRAASSLSLLRFPISIITDLAAENPEILGPLALDLSHRLNHLRARLAGANGAP